VELQDHHQAFADAGATLIAISDDELELSSALSESLSLSFPLASDPGGALIRSWSLWDDENEASWPAVYVVSADGVISWVHLSETYRKRPTSDDILPAVKRAVERAGAR
jgi:peroxiredoxin